MVLYAVSHVLESILEMVLGLDFIICRDLWAPYFSFSFIKKSDTVSKINRNGLHAVE